MPRFLLVSALPQPGIGHPYLVVDPHAATGPKPRVRYVGVRSAIASSSSAEVAEHKAARYRSAQQVIVDHHHLRREAGHTLMVHAEVVAQDSEAAAVAFDKMAAASRQRDIETELCHELVGLGVEPKAAPVLAAELLSSKLVAEHSSGNQHLVFVLPNPAKGESPEHNLIGGLRGWLAARTHQAPASAPAGV